MVPTKDGDTPTPPVANLGVPSGEFWNDQTVGLASDMGVPIGERGLMSSGILTDRFDGLKVGMVGLNSGADTLGLNSKAPALRNRGEPKGEEGLDDIGVPFELTVKICSKGSLTSLRAMCMDGD